MSTVMILLGYAVGVAGALCATVLMARHIITNMSHFNDDATLEIHKLGGTGKLALGSELGSLGWRADGDAYVTRLADRPARLTFASGMWRLEVEAAPGAQPRDELVLRWGFGDDARSHGWASAGEVRCEGSRAIGALAHQGLREAMTQLARFAPPRGAELGTLEVGPDGGYTLTSGPQRNAAVLDPRNWSGDGTLTFELLTRALESNRTPTREALLGVVGDEGAPAKARALALASLRSLQGEGDALTALSAGAPGAPLEVKIQWALTMPEALDPDEAYGLLKRAVAMSQGAEHHHAMRMLCARFAMRACADRKFPPDVRAGALIIAAQNGEDVGAEITRVLRHERGSFRLLLIERLGDEDPEVLRSVAPELISQGHQPVVRAVIAALVKARDARDLSLWLRALDTPGTHHADLIEALEAHGGAACARALVGFGSPRDDALGRQALEAAARIAERVGAHGSLSVSEQGGRGDLELSRRSGPGDISQV